MKEKLQFIEVENEVLYKELQEIEAQVAQVSSLTLDYKQIS